jgi:hypothetical protein
MADDGSAVQRLASLSEEQRRKAMECFAVLRPHLEDGVPLLRAARDAGIPFRTAQRWLARHRQDGLVWLACSTRNDAGKHRLPSQFVALVEGLALKRTRSATAAIHRRVAEMAKTQGWPMPSYSTVRAILAELDPAMVTLAHDGAAAYRDAFNHLPDAPARLTRPGRPATRCWTSWCSRDPDLCGVVGYVKARRRPGNSTTGYVNPVNKYQDTPSSRHERRGFPS